MLRVQPAFVSHVMVLLCRQLARRTLAPLAVVGAFLAVPSAGLARTCKDYTLTRTSSGRSLILHRCDRVTIRLNQAFDGGYSWNVSRRPSAKVLKLVSDKTVVGTPKGVVGGTDTRIFVYRAVGRGKTSLKLTESRPFMRDSQIAKFTLFVRVR